MQQELTMPKGKSSGKKKNKKSQSSLITERKRKSSNRIKNTRASKKRSVSAKEKISKINIEEEDTSDKENIDPKKLAATELKLPTEYADFQVLFEQPEQYRLPQYGRHDHRIPLQEEKDPACRKIYAMSAKEPTVLKEYIAENLEKGIIRPSTSQAGFGVLFVPKKTGELRLCVDYRPLNNI